MKFQKINLGLFFLFSITLSIGQTPLFEKNKCIIISEENKPTAYVDTIFKGKPSLKLDSKNQSIAITKGLGVKNFKVDMDIAGEVMAGLGFRVASEKNYQFIYFRPQLGGTQEAIQYIPIYNGALSWVFYNYPTYETRADIERLEWFHATIEVRGTHLKVFVDHNTEPQMDVTLLDNELSGGNLLLRSMFGTSYFANVTYEPLTDTTSVPPAINKKDFLRKWDISQQFPRDTVTGYFDNAVHKAHTSNEWRSIHDPKDNFMNFSKYFEYPNGLLVARTNISSKGDKEINLHFDFVGKLRILLNDEEVFNYQRIRFERMFDGTFRVRLHLQKGENTLIFVSEGDAAFFGEGFKTMGRFQHTNWGYIARLGN
ncbi:MAG: hypothetical protein AAFO99_13180 [Bacteroidota bacterium]